MKHEPKTRPRFFFATAFLPCPYVAGRIERRLVSVLEGRHLDWQHTTFSRAGFRRSHDLVYAPACPDCDACKAVRVRTGDFRPTRSQRRVTARNRDLLAESQAPRATSEQYALFASYQRARHAAGDMARMDEADYRALIEDTPVSTEVIEFRGTESDLKAVLLLDRLDDGLSAVYSFFDPDDDRRSLGTYMILWAIEETRRRNLARLYLGYWIADCAKMSYKAQFQPLEAFTPDGWRPLVEIA